MLTRLLNPPKIVLRFSSSLSPQFTPRSQYLGVSWRYWVFISRPLSSPLAPARSTKDNVDNRGVDELDAGTIRFDVMGTSLPTSSRRHLALYLTRSAEAVPPELRSGFPLGFLKAELAF